MADTVAYLGPEGTFTEEAARRFLAIARAPGARTLPVSSPAAALAEVRAGTASHACVAIENSVDGAVTQTLDALADGGVQIYRELDLPIAFTIMARDDAVTPRTVAAHPVALRQVERWLERAYPGIQPVPASSNAAAAQLVAEGKADIAAAPDRAAQLWGLTRVATRVADHGDAHTRFALVGPSGAVPEPTGRDRTEILFTIPHQVGSLVGVLGEFAERGVNMSAISSRPTRATFGTYIFYLTVEGHISQPEVAEALHEVEAASLKYAFLGSWPAATPTGQEKDAS